MDPVVRICSSFTTYSKLHLLKLWGPGLGCPRRPPFSMLPFPTFFLSYSTLTSLSLPCHRDVFLSLFQYKPCYPPRSKVLLNNYLFAARQLPSLSTAIQTSDSLFCLLTNLQPCFSMALYTWQLCPYCYNLYLVIFQKSY